MSDSTDIDDLFGIGSPPPATPAPAPAVAPTKGVDARKEARVNVKWAARVLLSDGTVVALRVRDVSETGIGLISERPIAANATLRVAVAVAVAVPDVNAPGKFATVIGSFRTAHVTVSGPDLLYGGNWIDLEGSGRELISRWIRKLRR